MESKLAVEIARGLRNGDYLLLTGAGTTLDCSGLLGSFLGGGALKEKLAASAELNPAYSLQKIFSILSDSTIEAQITKRYRATDIGLGVQLLAAINWRRIYTFNIDDAIECAFEQRRQSGKPCKKLTSILYNDLYEEESTVEDLQLIKLHGCVRKPEVNYVFDHKQYLGMISQPNPWLNSFSHLIRTEPIIIAGTAIDEIDLEYYLQFRSHYKRRPEDAPSIIVEPNPDQFTRQACERFGLNLFHGTIIEFFDAVAETSKNDIFINNVVSKENSDLFNDELSLNDRVNFEFAFDRVAPPYGSPQTGKFFLGKPPTWADINANADIPRAAYSDLMERILNKLSNGESKLTLISDETSSGKTTLLKRIALSLIGDGFVIFEHNGSNFDVNLVGRALEKIKHKFILIVDDFADHATVFARLMPRIQDNGHILAIERAYRKPYFISNYPETTTSIIENGIHFSKDEALTLVATLKEAGFMGGKGFHEVRHLPKIVGQPIGIASCIIRNDFRPFERIIEELWNESTSEERSNFVLIALASFCYRVGLNFSIAKSVCFLDELEAQLNQPAALSLSLLTHGQKFIVPESPVIAEHVLTYVSRHNPGLLLSAFSKLADNLAPYVSIKTIRSRTPQARLAGRLLDYDNIAKRLLGEDAEKFYDSIKSKWSWNSRYWEQYALLKFDTYLSLDKDPDYLAQALQHARHAVSIEAHVHSYTTLSKILFGAMEADLQTRDRNFDDGWSNANLAIYKEKTWEQLSPVAFRISFKAAIAYCKMGGSLNVRQRRDVAEYFELCRRRNVGGQDFWQLCADVSDICGVPLL